MQRAVVAVKPNTDKVVAIAARYLITILEVASASIRTDGTSTNGAPIPSYTGHLWIC